MSTHVFHSKDSNTEDFVRGSEMSGSNSEGSTNDVYIPHSEESTTNAYLSDREESTTEVYVSENKEWMMESNESTNKVSESEEWMTESEESITTAHTGNSGSENSPPGSKKLKDGGQTLYHRAGISVKQFRFLLLHYAVKYSLPERALSDLLRLLKVILPTGAAAPQVCICCFSQRSLNLRLHYT